MTSTDRKPLVLVVEDDAAVRSLIAATLDIDLRPNAARSALTGKLHAAFRTGRGQSVR